MSEKELQTLNEAITHCETMQKAKGKPKRKPGKAPKKRTTEIKASNIVPTKEYRDNYKKVFGHD